MTCRDIFNSFSQVLDSSIVFGIHHFYKQKLQRLEELMTLWLWFVKICNKSNMTWRVPLVEQELLILPDAPEFTRSGLSWVRVAQTLAFCVVLCRTLFMFLIFFFWPPISIFGPSDYSFCIFCFHKQLWSTFQLISTNQTTIYYLKSPKTKNKTHDIWRMVIRFMVWDSHKHVAELNLLKQS